MCTNKDEASEAYLLPNEILVAIYDLLSPEDFNAARRACRNWMIASQDDRLLQKMLLRGGWMTGIHAERQSRSVDLASNSWYLSRRLARECALKPGWTGNGMRGPSADAVAVGLTHLTDATELADGDHARLKFTSSVCGGFVLVANGCLIHVYQIQASVQTFITTIACPRKVLSVSMDTSTGHHGIAALLEGRYGLLERDISQPFSSTEKAS